MDNQPNNYANTHNNDPGLQRRSTMPNKSASKPSHKDSFREFDKMNDLN